MSTKLILLSLIFISAFKNSQAAVNYKPTPYQKKLKHEINKDYRNLPFVDKLDERGSFKVSQFDLTKDNFDGYKDEEDQDSYTREDSYKVLIAPKDSVVSF